MNFISKLIPSFGQNGVDASPDKVANGLAAIQKGDELDSQTGIDFQNALAGVGGMSQITNLLGGSDTGKNLLGKLGGFMGRRRRVMRNVDLIKTGDDFLDLAEEAEPKLHPCNVKSIKSVCQGKEGEAMTKCA